MPYGGALKTAKVILNSVPVLTVCKIPLNGWDSLNFLLETRYSVNKMFAGDPERLREMILSILQHVTNVHDFPENIQHKVAHPPYKYCSPFTFKKAPDPHQNQDLDPH